MSRPTRRDADGIDLIYPGPDGLTPHFQGQPVSSAEEYQQIQATIQARRSEKKADRQYGTPCIACGAPVKRRVGHDAGCPVAAPSPTSRRI